VLVVDPQHVLDADRQLLQLVDERLVRGWEVLAQPAPLTGAVRFLDDCKNRIGKVTPVILRRLARFFPTFRESSRDEAIHRGDVRLALLAPLARQRAMSVPIHRAIVEPRSRVINFVEAIVSR
jgi:hypothetical protein